jgi:hypothetical protein
MSRDFLLKLMPFSALSFLATPVRYVTLFNAI